MSSVRGYTDPYLSMYRRVPRRVDGVCRVCRGAPREGFRICWSCSETKGQVSYPVELVVPISLYRLREQLHRVLWNYKNGSPDAARARHRLQVAATLARLISRHTPCLVAAGGSDWNVIAPVPSSSGREGPHPLQQALQMTYLKNAVRPLLRASTTPPARVRARDDGYATIEDVDGLRVLLVDDTFTSGSHVQSAASTLQLAGATVVAVVVIGRVIDPEFNEECRALWEQAGEEPFDFDVCCLE